MAGREISFIDGVWVKLINYARVISRPRGATAAEIDLGRKLAIHPVENRRRRVRVPICAVKDKPIGGGGVQEGAIWESRSGHRTKPVVTYRKIVRERTEYSRRRI